MKFYQNEIKGVSAIDWKPFPKAPIVSDKQFSCDKIEDRLKEIEGLFGLTVSS